MYDKISLNLLFILNPYIDQRILRTLLVITFPKNIGFVLSCDGEFNEYGNVISNTTIEVMVKKTRIIHVFKNKLAETELTN